MNIKLMKFSSMILVACLIGVVPATASADFWSDLSDFLGGGGTPTDQDSKGDREDGFTVGDAVNAQIGYTPPNANGNPTYGYYKGVPDQVEQKVGTGTPNDDSVNGDPNW